MVIRGKTQFITATQGIPKKYEEYLNKRIHTFLWDSKSPLPIATPLLSVNYHEGGVKALNIKARNEAINIVKLRKLADYSHNHPLASDATLEIILACVKHPNHPTSENGPSITDIFLQSTWKSKHITHKHLPGDLNTGSKYNLTLNTPNLSLSHKLDLPAWFHIGKITNAKPHEHKCTSKCLWNLHNTRMVSDLVQIESYHKHPDHEEKSKKCICTQCSSPPQPLL